MARTRTTKTLAQRIDLNYFKRPTPLKRAKLWLSVAIPTLAALWIAWHALRGDTQVYSSGTMSQAHAVLENQCAACHVQTTGSFSAKASHNACLNCHDGPLHHASHQEAPDCAACHAEHRGQVNLKVVQTASCAQCHSELQKAATGVPFAAHISSFENGHPEFAAVRSSTKDPGTIRVNHSVHLKPIRQGPNGPDVRLDCGDCHRTAGALSTGQARTWRYADVQYATAGTTYSDNDEVLLGTAKTLPPYRPPTGRELMAPVKFATACAGCHSLAFDKRFNEGAPHDKPEIVHAYLLGKFTGYIAAHPAELREVREPGRDLTGKPVQPEARVYATQREWVVARVSEAEELLWRKTCKQCHELNFAEQKGPRHIARASDEIALADSNRLPAVAPAQTTLVWMPHARFDHDAHRGFSCISCHEKAVQSSETSDVLLPGIATCRTCHAPGAAHAPSYCSECHTYHDWAQRKEVKPGFTLPVRRPGGR